MTIEFAQPEFHASVAEVRHTAALLEEVRARASGQVDGLLESWRGAAASEFAEGWSDWLAASGRVARSLTGIADSMAVCADALTTCEGRTATSLDALTGRLS